MEEMRKGRAVSGHNLLGRITEQLDDLVRHKALLGRHQRLRDLFRKPYHRLINWHRRGCRVCVGGTIEVRVPPEFSGKRVETYETAEFGVLHRWCRDNERGLFIDVGCSIGYYSCAALFSSPSIEVVAIDSDLHSLKVAQRMCSYAGPCRLTLIQGMIADVSGSILDYRAAGEATAKALASPGVRGEIAATNYRNFDANRSAHQDIPTHTLDGLFPADTLRGKPLLIKVDVEGAEWYVLNGARGILRRSSPVLIVSVHPSFLPRYGQSKQDIMSLLNGHGYGVELLGIDHEEHWLCKRIEAHTPQP